MKWLRSVWYRWRHRRLIRDMKADVENRYLAIESRRARLFQDLIDAEGDSRSLGQHVQTQGPLHRG